MTTQLKRSFKQPLIIFSILGLLVFWRYSYFILVPNVSDAMESVSKKNISPGIINGLSIDRDTIKNIDPDGQYLPPDAFKDKSLTKVKVERRLDFAGLAKVNTVTSSEFSWKREFSDYYGMGGIISSSDKYLVILLNRKSGFDFDESINVLSGYSGPPATIYLFYNTSKIGYDDIYILNRKTGKTVKRYRSDLVFFRSFYNNTDDTFYFRFSDKIIYRRLKLD
ncbi:hypothetical protein [Pedobacter cryoconitis]|uniref:Uncharacterized protein n=1 Tax=Pedobacter cryoconitis TaxID=188932 RepID=A0A327T9S7_9SPHI|nr:hypothetical protein [Pedobacter cryoconitis]RAJ37155.1 hypothetical protein LY11_00230 [Pedobacter cryoconitis]